MTFQVDSKVMKLGLEEALKHQVNIIEELVKVSSVCSHLPEEEILSQVNAYVMLRTKCLALRVDVSQYDSEYNRFISKLPDSLKTEAQLIGVIRGRQT